MQVLQGLPGSPPEGAGRGGEAQVRKEPRRGLMRRMVSAILRPLLWNRAGRVLGVAAAAVIATAALASAEAPETPEAARREPVRMVLDRPVLTPVSYTHLTLPTKRIV